MKARPWCVWVVNISQTALQLWASVSTALYSPSPLNHRLPHSHQAQSHCWLSEILSVCLHVSCLHHCNTGGWTSYQEKTSLTLRWMDQGCLPGDGSQRELSSHQDVSVPGGGIPIILGSISRTHPAGKSRISEKFQILFELLGQV